MGQYHLLQNKEHDEEVADRPITSTRTVNPKLWKCLWAALFFFGGCVFTLVSLLASKHALSHGTAFAGDLSFLSMFPGESACQTCCR